MKKTLLIILPALAFQALAQDQTINGNLYIGESHSTVGYGKGLFFNGNTDDCWLNRMNSGMNRTEFRVNFSDDNAGDDRFVIGTTNSTQGWLPQVTVLNSGKVGIGISNPHYSLDVNGAMVLNGNLANLASPGTLLSALANSAQMLIGWNRTGGDGEADFVTNQGGGNSGGFAFYNYPNLGLEVQLFRILGNGNVGIGVERPGDKLSVNGNIRAKEIKVETTGWPDYVFSFDFKKPLLEDLEHYISEYKHLPEVPSATEIKRNGLDLGAMNALLLKKVEELTLYLIEQDKKIKTLEKRLGDLNSEHFF